MPCFSMHLVEGEMILNKLNMNSEEQMLFLLGCTLPDLTSDKNVSHFRPAWQNNLITKYPDMNYVKEKYDKRSLNAIDLGILAHLHIDTMYVTRLWNKFFVIEDECGNLSTDTGNELYVRIHAMKETRIPLWDFFSRDWFYGEYDALTPILCHKYKPRVPRLSMLHDVNTVITECVPDDIEAAQDTLDYYMNPARCTGSRNKIFTLDDIECFLNESVEEYINEYISNAQA